MYKKLILLAALVAMIGVVVTGCGSSSSDSSDSSSSSGTANTAGVGSGTSPDTAAPDSTIALAADPGGALAYTQKSLTGKAGNVKINFTNESPIGHDVAIENAAGKKIAESNVITGSTTSVEFKAKPGKYTYFCTLPGHEEAGMKGTLTIK